MHRSHRLARWTVHVAVFVLLLKAAVPLLASVAAQAQGKGVAEICDVYGVALPTHQARADHPEHAHHAGHAGHAIDAGHAGHAGHGEPGSDSRHRGDHCVLTALSTLATPASLEGVDLAVANGALAYTHAASERSDRAPDASARWAVLL
ncbi:MAG: hypothetical protein ACREXI_08540, partial [Caldimonas sp.]